MTTEAEAAPAPEVPTEEARNAAFTGGYDDTAPAETPTPAVAEAQEPTLPAESDEDPVTLDRKTLNRLLAAAEKAEGTDGEFRKVFGTIGTVKSEVLQRISAGAPIPEQALAKLKEEYPEFAEILTPILTHRGSGTGEPATVDPEKLKAAVKEARELELVAEVDAHHPGWIEVIGKPEDAENPYRKWVATLPAAEQKRINNTFSTHVIIDSLDRYKAAAAAPAPKPPAERGAARTDRLRDAVPPKGGGAAPAPSLPTRQDAYLSGYQSG